MKRLNRLKCLSFGKPFQLHLIFVSKEIFDNKYIWCQCLKTFFSVTDEEANYAGAFVSHQAFVRDEEKSFITEISDANV
jgi:hypothetical protein